MRHEELIQAAVQELQLTLRPFGIDISARLIGGIVGGQDVEFRGNFEDRTHSPARPYGMPFVIPVSKLNQPGGIRFVAERALLFLMREVRLHQGRDKPVSAGPERPAVDGAPFPSAIRSHDTENGRCIVHAELGRFVEDNPFRSSFERAEWWYEPKIGPFVFVPGCIYECSRFAAMRDVIVRAEMIGQRYVFDGDRRVDVSGTATAAVGGAWAAPTQSLGQATEQFVADAKAGYLDEVKQIEAGIHPGQQLDKAAKMVREFHQQHSMGGMDIPGMDVVQANIEQVLDSACACKTLLNGHEPGCPLAGR